VTPGTLWKANHTGGGAVRAEVTALEARVEKLERQMAELLQ